ncbi:hypothetical protein QG37_06376 [Candidozyma auris]|nr:hypothetical protein QG37_06376 [[Candida] auris]
MWKKEENIISIASWTCRPYGSPSNVFLYTAFIDKYQPLQTILGLFALRSSLVSNTTRQDTLEGVVVVK